MNVNPKIVAGGLAGAVTVVLVWCLSLVGVDMPVEVASAITLIISVLAAYIRPQGDWSPRD